MPAPFLADAAVVVAAAVAVVMAAVGASALRRASMAGSCSAMRYLVATPQKSVKQFGYTALLVIYMVFPATR